VIRFEEMQIVIDEFDEMLNLGFHPIDGYFSDA
jgi:hypothetical protein